MAISRGFTLVELLVSLVILALVALLMAAGAGVERRSWERVDRSTNDADTVAAAQSLVRDRLSRLVPLTRYDSVSPYADIDGKHDVLFFVAPASDGQQPNPLVDYRLSLSTGSELVLSGIDDLAAQKIAQRTDRVLLRRVAELDLAYFGPPYASTDVPRWNDHWPNQARPPQLIRVRVAFAHGDRRVWSDLIIHPFATIDTQCVINSRNGKCKGR